jgi:hypothetical protein
MTNQIPEMQDTETWWLPELSFLRSNFLMVYKFTLTQSPIPLSPRPVGVLAWAFHRVWGDWSCVGGVHMGVSLSPCCSSWAATAATLGGPGEGSLL